MNDNQGGFGNENRNTSHIGYCDVIYCFVMKNSQNNVAEVGEKIRM